MRPRTVSWRRLLRLHVLALAVWAVMSVPNAAAQPRSADPAPEPVQPPRREITPQFAREGAPHSAPAVEPNAAAPKWQLTPDQQSWFKYGVRRGLFVLIVASILTGIVLAIRGHVLPTRDIPGLIAMEEAVARATEMGRPTLFTVGGGTELKRVQLFASMPLLREVSRMSGELGNRQMVPVCFPETMPVHLNAMRDGYTDAAALEQFRSDDVRFFPGGLFFFAMGAMGWMLEERPAACFYFGYWIADSLMFSETGQTIQAMQIAGTDQLPQVPFFVVSCDYTIIGEEFWAASAKLSGAPELQGSLGAQDLFKIVVLALVVGGCALCAWPAFAEFVKFLQTTLR